MKFKTLIDVRSIEEFETGAVERSINIPLNQIQDKLEEIKQMPQPIALCCLSGGRSGMATDFLSNEGVECFNAGGWEATNSAIQNNELCWDL